ncbi:6-phosphofructokinase [Colwellia sp. MSW7]|uniref:6-phosphofructokinase n=1 Tax=Colwellia maritima TaxID=2912588 RepID=A0ABS9X0C6_9GAMM|nr:ATP-dependent 6-phosphofructokinase [Colwellia maritima]MCI2283212.1 6-phosphofructokinase [Colwellia maritima]
MKKINRIAILTSGGDAPGMNAAIRSVILAAHHYHIDVIGFYHGFNGLICKENINQTKCLSLVDTSNIIQRGGTILKSARCPEMQTEQGLKQAAKTLNNNEIEALIVIGGDGSFNGLIELKNYWHGQLIGIPGTIDNDLDGTDFTIGFATAVNTAIEAIDKIRDTADAFERIFIVELMGRHSGHITFNVGIACGAEQVLSFENFSIDDKEAKLQQLADEINTAQENRHSSYIIVIAENLWPGGAMELAKELRQKANVDCTACVLGHIQRGGSPVPKDRLLATKMGVAAVQAIIEGEHCIMIAEQNNTMCHINLAEAVKHHKVVNQQLVEAQENILALTAQNQY